MTEEEEILIGAVLRSKCPNPICASSVEVCTECSAEVWVSPATRASVPTGRIVCLECMARVFGPDGVRVMPQTDAQVTELREAMARRAGGG